MEGPLDVRDLARRQLPRSGHQYDRLRQPTALTTFNGALYTVFRSSTDSTLWISRSTNGVSWDLHQLPTTMTTQGAPTITPAGNALYVLYLSSTDQTVWLTSSNDGVNWSGPTQLPSYITVGSGSAGESDIGSDIAGDVLEEFVADLLEDLI